MEAAVFLAAMQGLQLPDGCTRLVRPRARDGRHRPGASERVRIEQLQGRGVVSPPTLMMPAEVSNQRPCQR